MKKLQENESSQVSFSNQTEEFEDSQIEDLSLADAVESPIQQYFSDEESFTESSQQTSGSSYHILDKIPPETVEMPFPRTVSTHAYCFFVQI